MNKSIFFTFTQIIVLRLVKMVAHALDLLVALVLHCIVIQRAVVSVMY